MPRRGLLLRVFERMSGRKAAVTGKAIRFVCPEDARDDADHAGFWMLLDVWNRYRHDTYKDGSNDEVCADTNASPMHTHSCPCSCLVSHVFGSCFWQTPYILASDVEKAAAQMAQAAAQAAAPKVATKPPVYAYFELKKTGVHVATDKSGISNQMPCEFRCRASSIRCRRRRARRGLRR